MSDLEFNEQKGKHVSETIDGDAPYQFDSSSTEETLTVPAEEGDVNYRSAETGQFVSEEEAEAHPATTVSEKKTAVLGKTRVVMERMVGDIDTGHGEGFAAYSDDDGTVAASYWMSQADWEAFGQPDVITVAVVPRDILN